MVVEVKSKLQQSDIRVFSDSLWELASFERFYQPTQVFKSFAGMLGGTAEALCVRASEREQGIAAIHGAVFAYEAASGPTIETYFKGEAYCATLACVHVLQRALWIQASPQQWMSPESGENSFAGFVAFLLQATTDEKDRWSFVRPDVNRYVQPVVREFDAQQGASQKEEG